MGARLGDRALHVVFGHIGRIRFIPNHAQARISIRVGATGACGHGDFADDFGPEFSAFGILATFSVLDIGPFTMSGHGFLKIGYDKVSFYLGIKINSCLRGSSICFSLKRDFYTVSLIFRSTP